MLLLVLLVTTLLSCGNAERNSAADVRAFVDKFNEINETTDVLESLEQIGINSLELFRLGRPVGQFLAHLNATGQMSDDDLLAWDELREFLHLDFATISPYDGEYSAIVSSTIKFQLHALGQILNYAASERLSHVLRLQRNTSFFQPMGLLIGNSNDRAHNFSTAMNAYVRLNCKMPTKGGVMGVNLLHGAFQRLESRMPEEPAQDTPNGDRKDREMYELYKSVLLRNAMHAPEEAVRDVVRRLDELNEPSYIDAKILLTQMERKDMEDGRVVFEYSIKCREEEIFSEYAFTPSTLHTKLRSLHTDLIRILLLEVIISSGCDLPEDDYVQQSEKAIYSIEATAHFIAQWSRKFNQLFVAIM